MSGPDGQLIIADAIKWNNNGRSDVFDFLIPHILATTIDTLPKAPKTSFTWGDVNFIQEIADGLGSGNRRAREARLQQLDKDKKKKLIRLICRVKGEKVFDEDVEVKDVQVNVKDVDMITERILGKVTMETEDVL